MQDRIGCSKDAGLRNLHLQGFAQNQVWCEIVALARDLLTCTQMLASPAGFPGGNLTAAAADLHLCLGVSSAAPACSDPPCRDWTFEWPTAVRCGFAHDLRCPRVSQTVSQLSVGSVAAIRHR